MALQLPDQHGDQREQRLHESSSSLPDQRGEPAQLCVNTFRKSTILREHVRTSKTLREHVKKMQN